MNRKAFALCTILVGGVLGWVAVGLFLQADPGLNFPLFFLILTLVMLAFARLNNVQPRWRNLWLIIPMLGFAGMVAVRADPTLTTINIGAASLLALMAVHYLPMRRAVDRSGIMDHVIGGMETISSLMIYPFAEAIDALSFGRGLLGRSRGTTLAVGRGVIVALPIIGVMALLLASADAVFASYFDGVWRVFDISPQFASNAMFAAVIAFGVTGALAYGAGRRAPVELPAELAEESDDDLPRKDARKRKAFTLGIIESGIVLGAVNLLFGAFVIVQFTYFFGGTVNLATMNYSEYARRGFFELLAVSVLTLAVALWLDHVTIRANGRQTHAFRVLCVIMIALTGVLLVSAVQRMLLYENAYGFTHLRVYTLIFMLWMGVLFGVFLLQLFRVRENIFAFGLLLCAIGYLGTINAMNPDLYIAQHNIARYTNGDSTLDTLYLRQLSPDATPALIALFEDETAKAVAREEAAQWLAWQLYRLDREREHARVWDWNWSRYSTWITLDALRDQLPEYDPSRSFTSLDAERP